MKIFTVDFNPRIIYGCLVATVILLSYVSLGNRTLFVNYDLEIFMAVMSMLAAYCFKKGFE